MITIRGEETRDIDQVRALNLAAFEGGPEAGLVDTLRRSCVDHVSLVADDNGRVVGHILFTPVIVEGAEGSAEGMGLAPLAVLPGWQRQGIGSALVDRGLEMMRDRSAPFVVVLGHPGYYPRFGFELASSHGLKIQWPGVPDEAFMVIVYDAGALPQGGGIAKYRDEFDAAV